VQELHGQVLARYGRAGTLSTPPTSPYVPARDNMPQSSPHYVPSPPALAGPCQPFSCLCTTGCCSSNESQSSSRFQSSRFGELGAVRPPRAHRSPVLSPTNASLAVSLALSAVRVGVLELEFLRHGTPLQALMLLDGSGPLHPFLELDAPNGNGAALCNQRTSSTATPAWRSPPWRPCLPVSRASSRLCRRRPRIYTCCVATASCTPAWNNEISSRASHLTPGLFHG
jgi:hypothetical protein